MKMPGQQRPLSQNSLELIQIIFNSKIIIHTTNAWNYTQALFI
jgi:hypothetical protein